MWLLSGPNIPWQDLKLCYVKFPFVILTLWQINEDCEELKVSNGPIVWKLKFHHEMNKKPHFVFFDIQIFRLKSAYKIPFKKKTKPKRKLNKSSTFASVWNNFVNHFQHQNLFIFCAKEWAKGKWKKKMG